jgi:hypothetical protein
MDADVCNDEAVRILVEQVPRFRACRCVRRVCISWSFDDSWAVLCTVFWVLQKTLLIVVTDINAEKRYPVFDGYVYLEN